MMDLRVLLKRLIVANVVLLFVFVIFEMLFFQYLPVELQNYQNSLYENESEMFLSFVFGTLSFLIYVASMIYLWKLKKIGRTLLAVAWIVSLIVSAGMMPSVYTALGGICATIFNLLNGMILGLIYFSDLRLYFEEKPKEAT